MTGQGKTVLIPPRLRAGDTLRIIAPSCSRTFVMEFDNTRWIDERFAAMGFTQQFGEHVDEDDDFNSSSIASRVADLHAAFADPQVDGILSVIGGFSSNELLPYLDWELIAAHPKVFCGYSDFTALANAIHTKTGLLTYVGPHWSSFGMRDHFEPTGRWFRAATQQLAWSIEHSDFYADDLWFMEQNQRAVSSTAGPWVLTPGTVSGKVIGGNLGTLHLLQGTEFMPSLEGAVLFIEDDAAADALDFARTLASLLHAPAAAGLSGVAIGRFQEDSKITRNLLEQIVAKHPILQQVPVVANLDFGHTTPMFTLPIGGCTTLRARHQSVELTFAHKPGQLH